MARSLHLPWAGFTRMKLKRCSKHVLEEKEAELETLLHPDSPLHPILKILASALLVPRLALCWGYIPGCRGVRVGCW